MCKSGEYVYYACKLMWKIDNSLWNKSRFFLFFMSVYTMSMCIIVWNKLAKKVKYLGPTWQIENEIPRVIRNRITAIFFFWEDLGRDEFINWALGFSDATIG